MNSHSITSNKHLPLLRDLYSSTMGLSCSKLAYFNTVHSVPVFLQPWGETHFLLLLSLSYLSVLILLWSPLMPVKPIPCIKFCRNNQHGFLSPN